ncbi:MAG: hypothetical protein JWP87_1942 [Labilithrix sp.]|nr:hypothetical protein [Labilithrix sp.]
MVQRISRRRLCAGIQALRSTGSVARVILVEFLRASAKQTIPPGGQEPRRGHARNADGEQGADRHAAANGIRRWTSDGRAAWRSARKSKARCPARCTRVDMPALARGSLSLSPRHVPLARILGWPNGVGGAGDHALRQSGHGRADAREGSWPPRQRCHVRNHARATVGEFRGRPCIVACDLLLGGRAHGIAGHRACRDDSVAKTCRRRHVWRAVAIDGGIFLRTSVLRRRAFYHATMFGAFSVFWTAVPRRT